jgi:NADH:ubiquinone reductase (H+-translocating)
MRTLTRRIIIGAIAGALASAALVVTVGHPLFSVTFDIAIGAAFSVSVRPTSGTYVDNLIAAAALGVPLWALISVLVLPLSSGQMPEWSAAQMRQHFP